MLKTTVSILLYPLTLITSLVVAMTMLFQWQWPVVATALVMGTAMLLVMCFERVMPYRSTWRNSHHDISTDAGYLTVNLALRELVAQGLPFALLGLYAGSEATLPSISAWPDHWHPLAQVLLAILVLDFFEYWFHRCSHRWGFLWRFHAIHHSPKRLYFLNAARFHFLDWMALAVIDTAVVLALGADPRIAALTIVFIQVHGLFQHANINLKLGPLNYVVSGPELHRWHHSKHIHESDRNFGNNVIVWDLLFGTYFWPKERHVGAIGLFNSAYPQHYWGQLKAAFARNRIDKPKDFHQRKEHYYANLAAEDERIHQEATRSNRN